MVMRNIVRFHAGPVSPFARADHRPTFHEWVKALREPADNPRRDGPERLGDASIPFHAGVDTLGVGHDHG